MKFTCVVIITFLVVSCNQAMSQQFVVTPYGLRSASDTTKDYVIITFDSSANYLYQMTKKYVQKTFKNPDKVQKGDIEGEYLRLDQYQPGAFSFHLKKQQFPINAEYTAELEFKDNKIKYRLMNVSLKATNDVPVLWLRAGNSWNGYSRQHIYKTPHEIEHPEEKREIEEFFDKELNSLVSFIRN
jgi:hypothetical protein